jgi:hypothetical protein
MNDKSKSQLIMESVRVNLKIKNDKISRRVARSLGTSFVKKGINRGGKKFNGIEFSNFLTETAYFLLPEWLAKF